MSKLVNVAKKISNKLFSDLAIGQCVRIAGTVHSYTVEEGAYGEYKKFKGEFALSHNGETYMAAVAHLPEIAAEMLASGVVQAVSEAGDGFKGLEFAVEMVKNVDTDTRNARGYSWGVRPIIAPNATTSRALSLLEAVPVQKTLEFSAEPVVETVAEPVTENVDTVKPKKPKN